MKDKIITIIPSLYDGGAEKFTADLSYSLSDAYDHSLLVYNPKEKRYPHRGELMALDIPEKRNVLARIRRQLTVLKKIKRIKKSLQPKVVISHMLMANMLNILSRKNHKTICVLHGEWSVRSGHSILLDNYIKRTYNKADVLISVSHYIKNMFDSYYQLKVPHEVVYVGVDMKQIEAKGNEASAVDLPEKYLVYVAGFRPVKNHLKLIATLETYLKTNDISLVLVGDGPLRGEIERAIKKRGLEDKVRVVGNIVNPYPVIKNAKLSLVVSSSESFSLVVVESMVLGVPVIATDCGGPREIIAPNWDQEIELPYTNDFGILIPKPAKWTHNSLANEIQNLIENETLWRRISENGKQRAKIFDIKNSEKQYQEIINELITS